MLMLIFYRLQIKSFKKLKKKNIEKLYCQFSYPDVNDYIVEALVLILFIILDHE